MIDIDIISNPVKSSFDIRSKYFFERIEVYDDQGRLKKKVLGSDKKHVEICMEGMAHGPYVIELSGRGLFARLRLNYSL